MVLAIIKKNKVTKTFYFGEVQDAIAPLMVFIYVMKPKKKTTVKMQFYVGGKCLPTIDKMEQLKYLICINKSNKQ